MKRTSRFIDLTPCPCCRSIHTALLFTPIENPRQYGPNYRGECPATGKKVSIKLDIGLENPHIREEITAYTVSVDYGGELSITLRRFCEFFGRVVVVSSPADGETAEVVAAHPGVTLFQTDAFYREGASFNKGAALEEAFEAHGRAGWIALIDADILLPADADFGDMRPGYLYSARRRMLADPIDWSESLDWESLPLADDGEWAGYLHIFHATDHSLPAGGRWLSTLWKHAGGYDTELQSRWPMRRRSWLPFQVLHIGQDGRNWAGRVTPKLDGSIPDDAGKRQRQLEDFLWRRNHRGSCAGRFDHEKLPGDRLPGEL